MKKIIIACVALLSVSACGTVQNAQLQSAANVAQQEIGTTCAPLISMSPEEAGAWQEAQSAMSKCKNEYQEPWSRNLAMKASECGERMMNEVIRPASYSKSHFDKFLAERKDEHEQYARGEISWQEMSLLGHRRINEYFDNAEGGSYFNYAQCHNAILAQKVFPVYPNELKPTLTKFQTDVLAYSREADKKNVEPEDYMVAYQQLWNEFTASEQSQINRVNAQNAQAWQNYSKQLGEMSQQITEAEARNQQTVINTDCSKFGNRVQCRSY